MDAKRTRCMTNHPGEQAEEASSEVKAANGSGSEKSMIRSKLQRRTYRVICKGAAGRLFGKKATCVGVGWKLVRRGLLLKCM